MKITKNSLKQIIKEELDAMRENDRSEVEAMTQDYASRIRQGRRNIWVSRFSDEEVNNIVRGVIQRQIDRGKSTRYTRVAGLVNNEMRNIVTKRSETAVAHIPKSHLGKDDQIGPSGPRYIHGSDRIEEELEGIRESEVPARDMILGAFSRHKIPPQQIGFILHAIADAISDKMELKRIANDITNETAIGDGSVQLGDE